MDTIDNVKNLIYIVRGVGVMLDADLAAIYGYETRAFNQQVKNNIEKFDDDFRFQLKKDEYIEILRLKKKSLKTDETIDIPKDNSNAGNLKSKKLTSSWGGTRKLPYAFTEQGIYMLMTVLKGDLATKQSKTLIRVFKEMKDFILDNKNLVGPSELVRLSLQTVQNTADIAAIKDEMLTKSNIADFIQDFTSKRVGSEYLILNGETVEANLAYSAIYANAKRTIFVVDNYIGIKTLVLLKNANSNVDITIFSDNIGNGLHKKEYEDFCKQYPKYKIKFRNTNGIYHDRYVVVDYNTETERIYHCGASSKDAGNKVTTISEVIDRHIYHSLFDTLLKNPILSLPNKSASLP